MRCGRHRSRTLRNQAVEGFLGGLGDEWVEALGSGFKKEEVIEIENSNLPTLLSLITETSNHPHSQASYHLNR